MMNVYSLLCWRKSWPSQCKRTRSIQACKNRVLGVVWSAQSDEFRFTVSLATKPRTRRGLLSAMNSLFDSLGLVAPVVLEAFYLSQLVRTGVGMGWGDAREGFAQVGKVAVKSAPAGQRVISSLFQFELVWRYAEMSVARFADASITGCGAVCYLRAVSLFDMVVCCWRFTTAAVLQRQDWACTIPGLFCLLGVFPAGLPHTVGLVRRLQYHFTRSW